MSPRDEILERLRGKASKAEMPGPWQSQRNFPNLAERFAASLTAVRGEVRRTDSLESALAEVGTILDEISAKTVVANNEAPLSEVELGERWRDREWHVVGQTAGDLRDFCARADAGLSGVEAALAGNGQSRRSQRCWKEPIGDATAASAYRACARCASRVGHIHVDSFARSGSADAFKPQPHQRSEQIRGH